MKAYCDNCGISPASFRPGRDAKTGEPFEDLCCDQCHLVIATVSEREVPASGASVDVMRQALEALERAKNGLEWYWDLFPTTLSHADGEMAEQIDAAITSLRAAISADPRPDQARVSLPPPLKEQI